MTLPTDINFSRIEEGNQKDSMELIRELQDMYEEVAQNVNGFIRNSNEIDQANWTPTLTDTGGGTFAYTHQVGWSVRQGIFTQIWFDVRWNSSTSSGTLSLDLPYRVTLSDRNPFVGVVQPSIVNLGAGYSNVVIVAVPDTYRGEFQVTGNNVGYSNLNSPTTVGRLAGHLMYIGIEDE